MRELNTIQKRENESEINRLISELEDKSNISDGSHTFGELYHHRAIPIKKIHGSHGSMKIIQCMKIIL